MTNNSLTKIQSDVQLLLERELAQLYALKQNLSSTSVIYENSEQLSHLHDQLKQQFQDRAKVLAEHIARHEFIAKEFIRLELEQEQLQQSNATEQQRILELQGTVVNTRKHHQFLVEQHQGLQQTLQDLNHNCQQLDQQRLELQNHIANEEIQKQSLEDEVEKLEKQIHFLQSNIDQLRQLKEENMLSVMELTTRMRDVSSGKD